MEAVAEECRLRDLAYLDLPETLCGLEVHPLTPRLWTVLRAIHTPFLKGGEITDGHIGQFIAAILVSKTFAAPYESLADKVGAAVARYSTDECIEEINEYLRISFMDAPTGGKETKPIACGEAWLIHRFRGEPFNQPKDVTRDTPLRQLYQELRCYISDQGTPISNPSDLLNVQFAQTLTEALASGEITQEQIDAMNYRSMYGSE